MINKPILITGAARSGTSMTAGIVNLCGAWGGVLAGPTPYNERGMFENRAIVDKITKPYLANIGADPMGQYPLPDIALEWLRVKMIKDAPRFKDAVLSQMASQGYADGAWFYKGAKVCLLWPLWSEAFPGAKWIIVRRKAEDIAMSCVKTGFMRAYRNKEGWLSWVKEHEDRFNEMKDAELAIKEVWPQGMIEGDLSEIKEVVKWLGLEWKEQEVVDFISPALWKGGK